jgi:hypothetical protein
MQVSPRQIAQLRAVFGDCIPKENGLAILEASPQAPVDGFAALQPLVAHFAGGKLPPLPDGRSIPAATKLQLGALAAVKNLKSPDGLLKVLTEKKVNALFEDIKRMRDVPHHFLEEGCVHRSHVIAKRLEERGIFSEKIFTIPLGGDLVMQSPLAKLGYTVVWYHEAVVLHVQTNEGVERRVLDASLSDKPLSVDEWLAHMRGTNNAPLETFFLPRFAYGLGDRNNPATSWDEKELEQAAQWSTDWEACAAELEKFGFYDELPYLARGETPPVKIRT